MSEFSDLEPYEIASLGALTTLGVSTLFGVAACAVTGAAKLVTKHLLNAPEMLCAVTPSTAGFIAAGVTAVGTGLYAASRIAHYRNESLGLRTEKWTRHGSAIAASLCIALPLLGTAIPAAMQDAKHCPITTHAPSLG